MSAMCLSFSLSCPFFILHVTATDRPIPSLPSLHKHHYIKSLYTLITKTKSGKIIVVCQLCCLLAPLSPLPPPAPPWGERTDDNILFTDTHTYIHALHIVSIHFERHNTRRSSYSDVTAAACPGRASELAGVTLDMGTTRGGRHGGKEEVGTSDARPTLPISTHGVSYHNVVCILYSAVRCFLWECSTKCNTHIKINKHNMRCQTFP